MGHHHHHHHDDAPPEKAAISIFWRLFRRFALRYGVRLSIGIVAGLIMSSALSVTLRVMDFGLNVFEDMSVPAAVEPQAPQASDTVLPKQPPRAAATPAITPQPAATQQNGAPQTASKKKVDKYIAQANRLAARFGYDLKLDKDSALSLQTLVAILAIAFGMFILKASGEFITKYCLHWTGSRVVTDIRIALFDRIQAQSATFYDTHDIGQLISRCTNDTAIIEHTIGSSVADLIIAPLMIIAAVQFILQRAAEMHLFTQSVWLLIAIPGCILPVYAISRYLRKYQRRLLTGIATIVSRMQENFSGNRLVKAFNTEEHENKRFIYESNRYFKSVRKAMIAALLMTPIMQSVVLVLGAFFLFICYKYGISLASLATLGYAAQEAYRPLKDLAKINTDLQKTAACCERILNILDADTGLKVLEPVSAPTTFNSDITFNDVSFRYTTSDDDVLSHVSFTIPKGGLVAIVGATGSGKSTIASLLARFYDCTSGSITLDGIDIRHIDNAALRNLVSIVTQETFLFNETVGYNIRYGSPNATQQQVEAAAHNANADEFILATSEKYDHPVGERGNHLSGGQKQRVSIARALLKNPPILILDEATSALDTETEKLVQQAFDKLMADRTVLAIAHRLSTILNADLILVCEHGRIIERGTHQQLFELNGVYRKLYNLQFNSTQD